MWSPKVYNRKTWNNSEREAGSGAHWVSSSELVSATTPKERLEMAPTWSSPLSFYQPQVTSEKPWGYLKTYELMGNLRMLLL